MALLIGDVILDGLLTLLLLPKIMDELKKESKIGQSRNKRTTTGNMKKCKWFSKRKLTFTKDFSRKMSYRAR